MQTRRETIQQSMVVAGLLAAAGFPQFAHAAFNKVGFDASLCKMPLKHTVGEVFQRAKMSPSQAQTLQKMVLSYL